MDLVRPPVPQAVDPVLSEWVLLAVHDFVMCERHSHLPERLDGPSTVEWDHLRRRLKGGNVWEPEYRDHRLLPSLTVAVLRLSGFDRLDDLWALGRWYESYIEEPDQTMGMEFIVERHRRGYLAAHMDVLFEAELRMGFLDDWYAVFPLGDLLLAGRAGLTAAELTCAVGSGVLVPGREDLRVLAGLRG